MKRITLIAAVFGLVIFIVMSCNQPASNVEEPAGQTDEFIQITQQQFAAEKMEIGEVTTQYFDDEIACNGVIVAAPNGIAQISAPLAGIIETISCAPGEQVQKGQVLCTFSSNEFIGIQQEFAESSARLRQVKADYERSKALFDEKIGSEKDFIATESEYKAMTAKYRSLKLRLERLNLNVAKIENGEFYASFPVLAPISGTITSHNVALGQFIEQQKSMFEIVDAAQLQLQLSVFENQIGRLKAGQKIRFSALSNKDSSYMATLSSVGKTIDAESRAIRCIAKIDSRINQNLINQSYIEAAIVLDSQQAKALPNEAILKSGSDYFVFVVRKSDNQNYYLQKEQVKIGRVSDKFTEIIEGEALQKVVIHGVYNLSTE
jgi:cobalt-zinc-cadmium efflux system membrane fusion protein